MVQIITHNWWWGKKIVVVDDLNSHSANDALSANQWRVLDEKIDTLDLWNVKISTDEGNIFSSGLKLWLWNKEDLDNISPKDANTLYIPYQSTWGGWQPWVNTVAYYPLTSSSTVNDLSGNSYTLTNGWNVTFWTQQWVDCATFNWTLASVLTQSSISFNAFPTYTASVWMYITWTSGKYQTIYVIGASGGTWALWSWFRYNTWLCIWSRHPAYESVRRWNINWAWHLLTNVVNWSSSIQYLDWQQYQTLTNSLTDTQTVLSLWAPNGFHYDDDLTWYLSNFILENVSRSAQEVADYFELTKWAYWIS